MPEVKEIRKKVTKADFRRIADFVVEEYTRRKRERAPLERQWADIDRQIRMEPDIAFKKDGRGNMDVHKRWMSEMELPLQAQTLEVLTADARRMLFPEVGGWFRAHSLLSDEFLEKNENAPLISGDRSEQVSRFTQIDTDKLVEGVILQNMMQYDFDSTVDRINAEAFSYGVGVGRVRLAKKSIYVHTARGTEREDIMLPVLFPRSIKNTYLDDRAHKAMNEGYMIGPSVIYEEHRLYEDVVMSANKGGTNPNDENGGWMPSGLKDVVKRDDGYVTLIEYEGDLVVPRKTTSSLFVPGAIVTVALGGKDGDNSTRSVIRLRFRKKPYSSYLEFPYHYEDMASPYATGPLMKGRPIQMAATQALNRIMDAAALKNAPPVSYDPADAWYAQNEGPIIEPYAKWATTEGVTVHDDIGDLEGMLRVYVAQLQHYSDVTGVNAPRLGAQTNSHTTAFAKEAEISRGVIRTVDYVRSVGKGPMTRWLYMNYDLLRDTLSDERDMYIAPFRSFVRVSKDRLPERVEFDWFGSGGPADAKQKAADRLAAANQVVQLEMLKMQMGEQPNVEFISNLQKEVLREGGWIDVESILGGEKVSAGGNAASALAGGAGQNPGAAIAALQALGEQEP